MLVCFSFFQDSLASCNPSETVYSNTVFFTTACNSAIYATDQLPTIPPDHNIYATAYTSTGLSASCSAAEHLANESDEDLNYAVITFHANSTSSNDAVPNIIVKECEVSCDYASISHATVCNIAS